MTHPSIPGTDVHQKRATADRKPRCRYLGKLSNRCTAEVLQTEAEGAEVELCAAHMLAASRTLQRALDNPPSRPGLGSSRRAREAATPQATGGIVKRPGVTWVGER